MCRAGHALDPSNMLFRIPAEPDSLSSQSSKERDAERQAKNEERNLQHVLVADCAGNGICLAK